ncbi:MAG: hypothetical protein WEA56_17270 [Balneolaceae bacterium]
MDSKKSLGHFPFGPDSQDDSDYSFIPDLNGSDDVEVAEFENNTEDSNAGSDQNNEAKQRHDSGAKNEQYIQVGSVKVKRSSQTEYFKKEAEENNSKETPDFTLEREIYSSAPPSEEHSSEFRKSKKKVVSYYIEEETIQKVKTFADQKGESYSAVAASAFREYITKEGE